MYKTFVDPHFPPLLEFLLILVAIKWYIYGFNLQSLIFSEDKHRFLLLMAICIFPSTKSLQRIGHGADIGILRIVGLPPGTPVSVNFIREAPVIRSASLAGF